jgi:hypothetical protein
VLQQRLDRSRCVDQNALPAAQGADGPSANGAWVKPIGGHLVQVRLEQLGEGHPRPERTAHAPQTDQHSKQQCEVAGDVSRLLCRICMPALVVQSCSVGARQRQSGFDPTLDIISSRESVVAFCCHTVPATHYYPIDQRKRRMMQPAATTRNIGRSGCQGVGSLNLVGREIA